MKIFGLHKSLRHVSALVSNDAVVYALTGVHIRNLPDGNGQTIQVQACNGKSAVRVETPGMLGADMPSIGGMESAPDGSDEGIVDSAQFKRALTIRGRHSIPALDYAQVTLGDDRATFGTTDLESSSVTPTRLIEGRFPDLDSIIPDGDPEYSIEFDAKRLSDTLGILAKILQEQDGKDSHNRVKLSFYGKDKAVVVTGKTTQNDKLTALVMPLEFDKPKTKKNKVTR